MMHTIEDTEKKSINNEEFLKSVTFDFTFNKTDTCELVDKSILLQE